MKHVLCSFVFVLYLCLKEVEGTVGVSSPKITHLDFFCSFYILVIMESCNDNIIDIENNRLVPWIDIWQGGIY